MWSADCVFLSGMLITRRILAAALLREILSALIVIMAIGVVLLIEFGF
jgi:hypothetical protein